MDDSLTGKIIVIAGPASLAGAMRRLYACTLVDRTVDLTDSASASTMLPQTLGHTPANAPRLTERGMRLGDYLKN